jgi:cytochrome c551/c552
MRDWIKVVTMQGTGDFDKMDPFMEHSKLNAGIDMEVGPDGRIYVLEYGKGWFTENPDAGIVRIDYIKGNRPPKVDSLVVDKKSGMLPLAISARISAKDPENDVLTYVWTIAGKTVETKDPVLNYTFKEAGEYPLTVEVRDSEKLTAKSSEITVFAGNSEPMVDITLQGNRSFYFPGKSVPYEVKVNDNDSMDLKNLFVSTDYIESNEDLAAQGHQFIPEEVMGKNLTMNSDCKSCHKEQEKSIGPAYAQVAEKYKNVRGASSYLINKVIKGGAGVWGEVAMPAHPTLKVGDVKQMVTYVLSLSAGKAKAKSMPPSGLFSPNPPIADKQKTMVRLTAAYTDRGATGVRPLTATKTIILRNSSIDAGQLRTVTGFTSKDSSGNKYLLFPAGEGAVRVAHIDLTGIRSITLAGFGTGQPGNYRVEIRTDAVGGNIIGHGTVSATAKNISATIPLTATADGKTHDVFIVVRPEGAVSVRPLLKTIKFNP